MSTQAQGRSYQECLVEQLYTANPTLSSQVVQAFLQIPRDRFVSHYYQHQPGSRTWTRSDASDAADWYAQIYQDEGLVTQVDSSGRTLSSSSQPSVMARMLDALEIQQGMRILEVGTGTGYNAALLAILTGASRLVTTVDIDAGAVEHARHALAAMVGEGVHVICGDGTAGYDEHAPYDRIIVTASTPMILRCWQEQLAPDGILVGIVQPQYAPLGGIVQAHKQGKLLRGHVVGPATFMPLRAEAYPKRSIQIDAHAPLFTSFAFEPTLFPPRLLQENPQFAFFLYMTFPDLYVFLKPRKDTIFFYRETAPQAYLVFRQGSSPAVELRGNPHGALHLWNQLVSTYSLWLHCGQPALSAYHFEMDEDAGRLFLKTPKGMIWPFL